MQVHRNENHITCDITKTCTLDCFACRRQTYKHRKIPPGGFRGQNMPLGDLEKLCEVYKTVGFCGQVSDPIFHPQFHELLEIMERTGRECHIHTAATSPKLKMDFYEKAFEIHPRGKWFFGFGVLFTSILTYLTPFAAKSDYKLLIAVRILEGLLGSIHKTCGQQKLVKTIKKISKYRKKGQ